MKWTHHILSSDTLTKKLGEHQGERQAPTRDSILRREACLRGISRATNLFVTYTTLHSMSIIGKVRYVHGWIWSPRAYHVQRTLQAGKVDFEKGIGCVVHQLRNEQYRLRAEHFVVGQSDILSNSEKPRRSSTETVALRRINSLEGLSPSHKIILSSQRKLRYM